MPVYQYRGQSINIADDDSEYRGYFEAAREHRLVVKKCLGCGLLRGEPGPGCPLCSSSSTKTMGKGAQSRKLGTTVCATI